MSLNVPIRFGIIGNSLSLNVPIMSGTMADYYQVRIKARVGRYERLRVGVYDVICELAECGMENLL
jgi:hypothetical protein